MKETEVIICDEDRDFAQRLIVFLRRQQDCGFHVRYFRNYEEMAADKPLGDQLLIGETQYEEMNRQKDNAVYAGQIHILCAKRSEDYPKGSIYKYQSATEILKILTGTEKESYNGTQDALSNDRKLRLKEEVLRRLSRQRDESEEEVYRVIDTCLLRENQQHPMRMEEQDLLRRELFNAIKGMDVIQELLDD